MIENSRQKLIDYLQRNMKKGYSVESLKWALIEQGYSRSIIESVIFEANKELAKKVPVFKEKPHIRYEIIDENNRPIIIKKPFWKKFLGR